MEDNCIMNNNAKCVICGKGYHLCMSCKDKMKAEPWRTHTDTPEHFKIFAVINGYNSKIYTKDEARTKLANVDLSDMNTYRSEIINIINDILYQEDDTDVKQKRSKKSFTKITNNEDEI